MPFAPSSVLAPSSKARSPSSVHVLPLGSHRVIGTLGLKKCGSSQKNNELALVDHVPFAGLNFGPCRTQSMSQEFTTNSSKFWLNVELDTKDSSQLNILNTPCHHVKRFGKGSS